MDCNNKTIIFDEVVKGWTSFRSFNPDMMVGMNNKFYSFKDGNLWEHHSDNVPRNNFYGVQYTSKITTILNDQPEATKVFKALSLEGNQSWTTLIKAFISSEEDFTTHNISGVDFVQKEGKWYSHIRGNEDDSDLSSHSTYGIGVVASSNGLVLQVVTANNSLDIGDMVYKDDMNYVGTITDISNDSITLDVVLQGVTGDFIYGKKDATIEGGEARGYVARVELENMSTEKVELFAVSAEVMQSFS